MVRMVVAITLVLALGRMLRLRPKTRFCRFCLSLSICCILVLTAVMLASRMAGLRPFRSGTWVWTRRLMLASLIWKLILSML